MAIKGKLTQKQTQRLALTPAVQQSLSFLQMPAAELDLTIESEVNANPFLILERSPGDTARSMPAFDNDGIAEVLDLGATLRTQLGTMRLSQAVMRAAQTITWSLDEKGYLIGDLDEVAQMAGVSEPDAQAALVAVQSCEPAGVGARSVVECLKLQMVEMGLDRRVVDKALSALDLLIDGKTAEATRRTGVEEGEIERVCYLLGRVSLDPASGFTGAPGPRIPDLEISLDSDGEYQVHVPPNRTWGLRFDQELFGSIPPNSPMRAMATQARTIINSVSQRQATLVKITEAIVERQKAFLEDGASSLRPLTRRDVAEDLQLAPSTVSRAVSGKYLIFGNEILEIAEFFSSKLLVSQCGETSGGAIRARVAEMIAEEADDERLTDEAIAESLRNEGVDISRRTVAKYRQCLNIPSSHQRHRVQKARRRVVHSKSQKTASDS